jgi:hypothetical protein
VWHKSLTFFVFDAFLVPFLRPPLTTSLVLSLLSLISLLSLKVREDTFVSSNSSKLIGGDPSCTGTDAASCTSTDAASCMSTDAVVGACGIDAVNGAGSCWINAVVVICWTDGTPNTFDG